ncbi:MAG TPA: hypothetical protein DD671_10420 [Balneolaceae bacterium]|mgnify:CR=1 FL=1|nr:hypothetical protein [Balneolaceae bacterium]
MKSCYHILFLLTAILLTHFSLASAQDAKDEIEKSISRDAMPASALSQINQFWNEQKKVDFYLQSHGEMISFEAKLDWEGHQYSIEFDSTGSLIDVEQLIKFEQLPEALRNTITEEIDKQYTRFKFTRIQRQFSASEEDDNDEVLEDVLDEDFEDLIINFEIEIDAQNKKVLGSFELLFDEHGNLIQKRRIVRRSLDNIW